MPQPVTSPDGRYIVWVTPRAELQVIVLPSGQMQSARTAILRLPLSIQGPVFEIQFMCWSLPVSECSAPGDGEVVHLSTDTVTLNLMLAYNSRIVVLKLETSASASSSIEVVGVVIDIDFPVHFGKSSAIDFVFDHDSAIIVFELATHASILSLTQAQRDDIPNRKFPTAEGYAISQRSQHKDSGTSASVLAIIVRDKHTDYVVVMERGSMVSTFKPDTIDAQGIMWAPDEKPMLVVWDSPAYGTKLKFYSALGHPLRQLSIGPETSVPAGLGLDFSGTGVSALGWVKKAGSRNVTMLAVGNGSKQVLLRSQDSQSLAIQAHTFQHPAVLHSSTTTIWQHLGPNAYRPVEGVWDLETGSIGEVELVAVSSDGQRVASKVNGSPNVVFVWSMKQDSVSAAIVFQREIRQLVWDWVSPGLIIVTAETMASFHYWCDCNEPPRQVIPPRLKGLSSTRWVGQLLRYSPSSPIETSAQNQSFFMVSSTKHIDIVRLDDNNYPSIFDTSKYNENESPLSLAKTNDSLNARSTQPTSSSRMSSGTSIFF